MFGKTTLLAGGLLALAAPFAQHGAHGAAPAQHSASAGEMFKKNCASCHITPDLRFKADKAWLGQIKETS